jgi:hypothetical protein
VHPDRVPTPEVPNSSAQVLRGETIVDAIFIIAIVALYAVTDCIVRALSRLGGVG